LLPLLVLCLLSITFFLLLDLFIPLLFPYTTLFRSSSPACSSAEARPHDSCRRSTVSPELAPPGPPAFGDHLVAHLPGDLRGRLHEVRPPRTARRGARSGPRWRGPRSGRRRSPGPGPAAPPPCKASTSAGASGCGNGST